MNALSPIPWASAHLQAANFPPSLCTGLVAPPVVQIATEDTAMATLYVIYPGSMNRPSYSLVVLCV